jgi:hypothetical protein
MVHQVGFIYKIIQGCTVKNIKFGIVTLFKNQALS